MGDLLRGGGDDRGGVDSKACLTLAFESGSCCADGAMTRDCAFSVLGGGVVPRGCCDCVAPVFGGGVVSRTLVPVASLAASLCVSGVVLVGTGRATVFVVGVWVMGFYR